MCYYFSKVYRIKGRIYEGFNNCSSIIFLGASSMYFILNVKKIKNKIQIVGNNNSVMNGINDEIK